MRDPRLSVPARVGLGVATVLVGYVALSVGITGELKARGGGVVNLPLTWRVILTAILSVLALGMGWIAVTGRE